MSNFIDLKLENQESIKEGIVLIDFYAEWCKPCQVMLPVIEDLSDELKDKSKTFKVNVDEESELSVKFNIRSVPTIVILKDGQEVERYVGIKDKNSLQSRIESLM